jgi:hypothetical protein
MNKKKLTLNEEISQINKLFGHMNMGSIIKESIGGPGKTIFNALDSGGSVAKYVGTKVSKEIEDAIVLASRNSDLITKSLGKPVTTFVDLLSLYPGFSKSEVALNVVSLMEKENAKNLMFSLSEKLGLINLNNLKINITKLIGPELQSLKTSLSGLELGSLKQLSDPITADAAVTLLPATITKIKEIINGISDSSMPATTKQSLLDTLDGIEFQINTRVISGEIENSEQTAINKNLVDDSDVSSINVSPLRFGFDLSDTRGKIDSMDFNEDFINYDKITFSPTDEIGSWKEDTLAFYSGYMDPEDPVPALYNHLMHGLKSGFIDLVNGEIEMGLKKLPISGFERYGVENFREFIKNLYDENRILFNIPEKSKGDLIFSFDISPPVVNKTNSINMNTLNKFNKTTYDNYEPGRYVWEKDPSTGKIDIYDIDTFKQNIEQTKNMNENYKKR